MNHFLVDVFNEILKTEELSVSDTNFPNLSLREIHILEKVCEAEKSDNSSAAIAAALRVTPGTLTTAISLLEKKGFVYREKDVADKRIVHIHATDIGKQAQEKHLAFHEELVDDILAPLSDEEAHVFVQALSNISKFFNDKYFAHTPRS